MLVGSTRGLHVYTFSVLFSILITVCLASDAPTITTKPDSSTVIQHKKLYLFCRATGNPEPTITWLRGNKKLNSRGKGRSKGSATKSGQYKIINYSLGSVLVFQEMQLSMNNKDIYCEATNGVGSVRSEPARIRVLEKDSVPKGYPNLKEAPNMAVVETGKTAIMKCNAEGDPVPRISWTKDSIPIQLSNHRFTILSIGSLQISKANQRDNGVYGCHATNNKGTTNGIANLYIKTRQVPPRFYNITKTEIINPGQSINLTCKALGHPTPEIKFRNGAAELTKEKMIGKGVLEIKNLHVSTNYTCTASNRLGEIDKLIQVKVRELPLPPSGLTVSEVRAKSVKLSWRRANPSDDNFTIFYIEKNKQQSRPCQLPNTCIRNVNKDSKMILDLLVNTEYVFYVATVNAVGQGRFSDAVYEMTGQTKPTSSPINVRAKTINENSVRVNWDPPEQPNGNIIKYHVRYSLKNLPLNLWTLHTVTGDETTAIIKDLFVGKVYSICISAVNNIDEGPYSDKIKVTIKIGSSEQPTNFKGEAISATALRLSWDKSDDSTILHYIIYYNISSHQNKWVKISANVHEYELEQLQPDTIYHLAISSKAAEESARTDIIQVKTFQYGYIVAPKNVRLIARASTFHALLTVTWDPVSGDGVEGYQVSYVVAPTQQHADDLSSRSSPAVKGVDTVGKHSTSYTITKLAFYTVYNVTVRATLAGNRYGSRSEVVSLRTIQAVPSKPLNVVISVLNSTAFKVSWNPPSKSNGKILGYYIEFFEMKGRQGNTLRPETLTYKGHYRTTMNTTLSNLKPDTWYKIQVIAFNPKGDGQVSDPKKAVTKKPVPSRPRSLHAKMDEDTDPPSLVVSWRPPQSSYGPLKGYRLSYHKVNYPDSEVTVIRFDNKKNMKKRLDNLDYGTLYEIRVAAKNLIDYGLPRIIETRTPDGIPTGQPMNFYLTQLTSESVRLSWDPPEIADRRGKIMSYQIRYKTLDASVYEEVNSTSKEQVIDVLQNSKNYVFQIRAFTSKGAGPWSDSYPHLMVNKHRAAPYDVKTVRLSDTLIEVSWSQKFVSDVDDYLIFFSKTQKPNMKEWGKLISGPHTSIDIELPDTNIYYIRVQARLHNGKLTELSDMIKTGSLLPDDPEMVSLFRITTQNPRSVGLSWKSPVKGIVTKYNITYRGVKTVLDDFGIDNTEIDPLKVILVSGSETSVHINQLKPIMKYTFKIRAIFSDDHLGASVKLKATTSYAPVKNMPKIGYQSRDKIEFDLRPVSRLKGNFKYFLVIVVPSPSLNTRDPNQWLTSELSTMVNTESPWIAFRYEYQLPDKFVLGNGQQTLADNSKPNQYSNLPLLDSDTQYQLFVRGYSSDKKYLSTSYTRRFQRKSNLPSINPSQSHSSFMTSTIGLITLACIGVLLILICLGLFAVFSRKKNGGNRASADRKLMNANGNNELTTSLLKMEPIKNDPSHPLVPIQDPVLLRRTEHETQAMINHPPILVSDLVEHVESLKANEGALFSEEYESIEPGQQFTWENSNLEVNKSRNRYANVIAYDHSRVCLKVTDDDPATCDYINANYMDGYRKHNAYIATQGPLPETFSDFWRMIWQQRTCSIIMMTKLEERQRVKCDQYWPTRGQENYGTINVSLVDVIELSTYTIRTFHIQKENSKEKREVRQFQFTAWPDHGLPAHPTPLLLFMRRVKAITPADSGPMVIHCSAGVGRTGTFIVIDASLERIKHERSVDVYGHVTCLRAQRNYMVQTEDQYIFIHDALLEAITSGNTEIMARNLYTHIEKLTHLETGETVTGLEMEFKSLSSLKLNSSRIISGNLPVNKCKNRLVNILPYESTRVSLHQIRGVDGSDYINASFIDGYRYRKAYIATQGPMADTTEDFWRLLWEHNSTIIIMLTKLYENGREKCHQYWPSERSARYQYFVVDPMSEYNMPQYILREFKVTDARDGQSRTIRQFQFTDWPEPQAVPSSGEGFIEFIGQVHKTKEQFGQDGPITVHCSAGVGRTGVFTALSIVLERMRYEGVVDMYQTVKMLRTQRPAMVQTEEQYGFCYRAALEYLGSFDQYN